jgi:transposase
MTEQLEIFDEAQSAHQPGKRQFHGRSRRYRPPYQKARIARMAYLAALGCSAREIADEAHISERHVYRMLSDYRIALAPKAPGQKSVSLAVSSDAFAAAYELAGRMGMDPNWMMARLLEAVLSERNVAVNLLDGVRHGR